MSYPSGTKLLLLSLGAVVASGVPGRANSDDVRRAPPPPVQAERVGAPAFRTRAEPQQWSIGDPTAEEQLLLEYMNRARLDPQGEADRILVDYGSADVKGAVDFFLTSERAPNRAVEYTRAENAAAFRSYAPKPPLAFDEALIQAARGHSEVLRANDVQSHWVEGKEKDLVGRAEDVGYDFRRIGESVGAYVDHMLYAHAGFAVDWGQPVKKYNASGQLVDCYPGGRPCLGHRSNLMEFDGPPSEPFVEVGIGVVADNDPSTEVGPRIVTINFGRQLGGSHAFVTGVCYDDANGNGSYDLSEGLGGVRIDVDGADHFAVSSASGGYAVPISGSPSTVQVTATGQEGTPGAVVGTQRRTVDFRGASVKVDFNRSPEPPLPAFLEFASTAPQAVPDLGPASVAFAVGAQPEEVSPLVGDVEIEVGIDHPARAELRVTLVAPGGVEVVLFDRTPPGTGLAGGFDSSLAPRNPLDAFVGKAYAGQWSLRVEDTVEGNTGNLTSTRLRIRPKWIRKLFSHASPLFVSKLKLKDTPTAAGDSLSLTAQVDVGSLPPAGAAPADLRLRARDAAHTELLHVVVPAASIVSRANGTSRTLVAAKLKGLDLPAPLPAAVEVELAIAGAIVREDVPLSAGAFNGATTAPLTDLFHVDSVKTKSVAGATTYTVKGRLAGPAPLVGTGVLEVSFGGSRLTGEMSAATQLGSKRTFRSAGALRKVVVDTAKRTFAFTVAANVVLAAGQPLDVALRLGDDGFYGAASIVPVASGSSLTY